MAVEATTTMIITMMVTPISATTAMMMRVGSNKEFWEY